MVEVLFKGLDGIQTVLAKRERACRRRSPGIHQRHLHHVVLLTAVAYEGAPVGNVHMHFGQFIEVVGEVRIAAAHDVVRDDGIDFDAGDVPAAVGNGAQYIDSSARPYDGEVAPGAEYVGERRWCRHKVVAIPGVPVVRVGIHDVGIGVGIDHDHLGAPDFINFDARQRIPLGEQRRGSPRPLGVHNVDEIATQICRDQGDQRNGYPGRNPAATRRSPHDACNCNRQRGEEDGVGTADEIQQRYQRQACKRSTYQICAIELRDALGCRANITENNSPVTKNGTAEAR